MIQDSDKSIANARGDQYKIYQRAYEHAVHFHRLHHEKSNLLFSAADVRYFVPNPPAPLGCYSNGFKLLRRENIYYDFDLSEEECAKKFATQVMNAAAGCGAIDVLFDFKYD